LKMKGHVELLMTENLKQVHAKLMKTLKNNVFHGSTNSNNDSDDGKENHYINVGCTWQTMQKVALMRNNHYYLAFCPVEFIDCQLDYICKMGRQYIAKWRNPFAATVQLRV
ncbi:hypothetical protein PISMIDRAFT_64770, partial [Pisolithus microcarpus 441]